MSGASEVVSRLERLIDKHPDSRWTSAAREAVELIGDMEQEIALLDQDQSDLARETAEVYGLLADSECKVDRLRVRLRQWAAHLDR